MRFISGTPKILLIYLVCMFAGQAIAVGIGLLLDPYSKTLALSVFIPLYYAMYWVAWRVALWIGDESPERRDGFRRRRRFPGEGRELAARTGGAGARSLRLGWRSGPTTLARGGIRRGRTC